MKQLFRRPASMHIEVEQLSAYLDGQLALAERTRVENHLQGCAACQRELESLRWTVALVQALPRVPVPRAFTLAEAQVNRRQRSAQPVWRGGLLRGLGAATALALVAVVAVTVLRQPGWTPSATVARQAPAALDVTQEAAPFAAAPAPEQPQALSVETVAAEKASEAVVALVAPESTVAPEPPAAPAAPAAARAAAPAPTAEAPSAKAAPAATATPEPAMMAMAPATTEAAPEMGAAALGRGGGGGPVDGAIPPEALTPEALPPISPVAEVLPAGVQLAYADLKGVWAINRAAGARELLRAESANTPQISPDGQLILYRTITETGIDLWLVRWDGTDVRRVLGDRDLPKTGLNRQYTGRSIQEARWTPGQSIVAVSVTLVPAPTAPETLPKTELWYLDVTTGKLRYITELDRAYWPAFSPQGDRFALLQYGTEAQPQGALTLFDADGSNSRVVLRFPASPAKVSYERQLAWTPDGQALWLALPDADQPGPGQLNGTTLYRVPVKGDAKVTAQLDAHQVAWSPDASRLVFTRYTSDVMDTVELYLANGDGADPRLYATLKYGEFVNWAPDGEHFVYQDNFQLYAGSPNAAPQRLGNGVSLVGLRWISADQFVSFHDTGSGWLLTVRGLDGRAAGLLPLPREAMLDVHLSQP